MKVLRLALLSGLGLSMAGAASAQQVNRTEGIPGFYNPKTHTFHTRIAPQQSAPDASTLKTYDGELKFAFKVTLGAPIKSGQALVCDANADVDDVSTTTFGNFYEETASSTATVSGSTATCYVNIHYSWALAGTTDTVSLSYGLEIVSTSATPSLVDYTTRTHTSEIAPIAVPAPGAITNIAVSATL